jgi:hypothetical protein
MQIRAIGETARGAGTIRYYEHEAMIADRVSARIAA